MVIWSGGGIIIGLVAVACILITKPCVNDMTADHQFFETHGWPKMLALWAASAISWPIGRAMNQGKERIVIDPETRQPMVVRSGGDHSLFFIPVQYWWLIFACLGVACACEY